jgi:hypothetical protein
VGGASGRCLALSPGVQTVASVASRFTRGTSIFKEVAGETVGCGDMSVLSGAGRGWCCSCRSMSCRGVWRARPGEGGVHGNAVVRSAWSGRPSWHMMAGSGRLARARSGDPVSGNWFHGSRLARWRGDVPGDGRWRAGSAGVASVGMVMAGRRGVAGAGLCQAGSALGCQQTSIGDWGRWRQRCSKNRGRGG